MAAFTSSSDDTDNNYHFDIFINHRGPDVKKTFASHLYRRLITHGLRVFLDNQELQEGENLTSQIKGAIASASVHVAIFSATYAESKWCLDELLLILESGAPLIPVFYGVTPANLRWTHGQDEGVYARALHNLEKKRTYDCQPRYNSTTVEKWRNALSSVSEISGLDLEAFKGDEGALLDKVIECVLKRVKKPQLDVAKYPVGLDEKAQDFERTVLSQQRRGVQVVGITGLGGVGKTTLATELFNRKSSNYSKSYFVFDVRENAKNSLHSLQRKLLNGLIQLDQDIDSVPQGKRMLRRYLSGCRVLMVLDDIDHADQVDALLPLEVLHPESLILITTRDKNVLARSGLPESSIYQLTGLNAQDSRKLFCSYAFHQPFPLSGFEYLVDQFLMACQELPLSLKVFGGLLYGNQDKYYWEEQLHRLEQTLPNEIQSTLQISYDALERDEKQIFLDIACFFIGEKKDTAIKIWEGSGWKGYLGFQTLQRKCLVQVDMENNIIMHDHLRDLGRDLAKEPALPRRLWRGIENNDDLSQHSSGMIDIRGIRLFRSEYKDHDSEQNFFSRYKIGKLQLLDVEILMESTLSGVHWPNLIWLRWHECHLPSLPSWIPIKNLWVLEIHGTELKTLWQTESQVPLQLRKLQIVAPLSNIPKSIGKLQHLEQIVIDCPLHNEFEELPDEIGQLRFLKVLVLRRCSKMRSLPNSLGNLTNLEHIDLSYCMDLERLPNSFKNLIRLRYLDLSWCFDLTISSETLGKISTLKYIDLSYCNKIVVLPFQVAHQRSLEKLNLKLMNLRELPSDIGELSDLEELELESPLLETLPPSIGDLRSLKYLVLRRCEKLKHLGESIGMLNQLIKLTVQDCSLQELPFKTVDGESETLTESRQQRRCSNLDSSSDKWMFRLKHLELCNTQKLDEVSFGEGVCPHLQHLLIKSCNDLAAVGTLPNALITLELTWCSKLRKIEGLWGLANLQKLEIKGCIEVEVLQGFATLFSLEVLEVTNCVKLKNIRGLEQLTKLRKLEVSSCPDLEDLPSVENLRSLENLDVSECVKVKNIQGLAQVTKLRTLKVRNCSYLEELTGIEHLRSLEILEAFNCVKLKSILGLEQLTELRKLEVSNCSELEDMPGVENLRSLKKLDVFGCVKLKRLQELTQMTKFEGEGSAQLTKLRRRAFTQLTKLHRLD